MLRRAAEMVIVEFTICYINQVHLPVCIVKSDPVKLWAFVSAPQKGIYFHTTVPLNSFSYIVQFNITVTSEREDPCWRGSFHDVAYCRKVLLI